MRLIDADKLPLDRIDDANYGSNYIHIAPTVEAIPKSVLEDIKAEIKQWYWQADKQELAKDPCVVDAMVDLFIRTIDNYISRKEQTDDTKNN